MTSNKRTGLGGFLLIAIAQTAHADQLSFDTLYRSPHFLGRGDTGVAVAEDFEAIFYNPAGLALGKSLYKQTVLLSPSVEASLQSRDLVRQVFIEEQNSPETLRNYLGKNLHFGLQNASALVLRRAAIGALVNMDSNILIAKSAEARGMESVQADLAINRALTFSVADSYWGDQLQVGATVKYLLRNEAQINSSLLEASNIADQLQADKAGVDRRGYGLDLGLMYTSKTPWRFGLHIENLGTTALKATENDESGRQLPQIITIGTAYEMKTKMDTLRLLADIRDLGGATESSLVKRLHLGAEMSVARIIGLTAGLNQGYPTAGIFFNLYFARADIGTYTQEIGESAGLRPDRRFYFRLMAGF